MAKRPTTKPTKPAKPTKPKGTTPPATPPRTILEIGTIAEKLDAQGDRQGAIVLYREWLATNSAPTAWVGWFNLGVLLRNAGDATGAIEAYETALKANPSSIHARINLGTTLETVNRPEDAITHWRAALAQLGKEANPNKELLCATLNNLGRRLEIMQRYTEAEEMLVRSLRVNPKQDSVLYHRIYLRQKQCAWPIYDPLPGITLEDQMRATSAVAMLSITDDPEVQLRTALSQVPGSIPKDLPKLAPKEGYSHDRLRIGYLSSNFGMHAVSILTAELYELHDRNRVEVWGFCWSPEDNTEMRARVIRAMDHFVRIKDMSDEAAAQAIRAAEIDVLVDLQGLTSGCRPKILAYRPAPVQVTYLGFPGTTGLPEVDYVLADRYIIPEESAKYFTEKPLYLPECFQANDRKREATAPKSRAEYGLPEDAFVFCAFNNNIKLTPEFFAAWMRTLHRTPNSVLWLLADNEKARENLGRCADEHGVARERLIFAPRVSVADYLGRFAAADLFLDLFPFNGGTTVADALWMGCPVLTLSGRSFSSRMAGSLLQAIGMPELITTTLEGYENKAAELAAAPNALTTIRDKIRANRDSSALFDTPSTVRHIEASFIAATQQIATGVPAIEEPRSIPTTPRPDEPVRGTPQVTQKVMAQPKLSIISHYYNHPKEVADQVAHWDQIDPVLRPFLEFILVDDCSEQAIPALQTALNLRTFRITTDIPWNHAGARNLGAFHAGGEWGLFFDIDQKLNLATLPTIIGNLDNLDPMTMYYLKINNLYGSSPEQKLSNHPNTFLINMKTFRTIGMYDEDFAGHYGYEDLYLPRVWEAAGGKRALLSDFTFFENVEFRTTNLNRDSTRNQHLAIFKMATGCKNSPGIMRFDWIET